MIGKGTRGSIIDLKNDTKSLLKIGSHCKYRARYFFRNVNKKRNKKEMCTINLFNVFIMIFISVIKNEDEGVSAGCRYIRHLGYVAMLFLCVMRMRGFVRL